MSYMERKQAILRSGPRITDGSVPPGLRRICLCDDCRFPFDAPTSGMATTLCRECRTERMEKGRAALALTVLARGRHQTAIVNALAECPERLARIGKYALRAYRKLPLFNEETHND